MRRYLIVNGVSTGALYLALWACVPSSATVTNAISSSLDSYVMGHTFLAPVLNRMITIAAGIAGFF